ncbi:P-II family nitrogen regulator [Membranihabitans marinus]|uniref:P-II family nitrogen regulator n=1 Tax=Membranihabitans marinus TaxID=1227546 RepID=UPI001F3640A5|nr:P-II family nitrogen regulator [Membranihabitans marinus]
MKKIEAIIRKSKFETVKDALANINVKFFTAQDVKGYGLQKGEKMVYRGSSYGTEYIDRIQMDIYTSDEKCGDIVSTILKAGATGEIGDGKITVLPIENIYRIRNAEENEMAI